MSREFIDAIASGNNLEAEDEFNNSISSKVGDALEFRRKEIAQTFAGNNGLVEEDSKPYVKQKPDGTWCVYDAEGNIVSEHESEDEAKAALPNKKDEESDLDEAGLENLNKVLLEYNIESFTSCKLMSIQFVNSAVIIGRVFHSISDWFMVSVKRYSNASFIQPFGGFSVSFKNSPTNGYLLSTIRPMNRPSNKYVSQKNQFECLILMGCFSNDSKYKESSL